MTTAPLADREPQPGTVPRGSPRCGLPRFTTEPHEPSPRRMRFEQLLRRVTYLVVFGVVTAALAGVAGLRTADASTSNDDVALTVFYAQATRPGIATPFEIDIVPAEPGPLPETITVEVSSEYLSMFDEKDWTRNPTRPRPTGPSRRGSTNWTT